MIKKIVKYFLILAISFLLVDNSSFAISLKFNGFIADEANILSEEVENDLNITLYDLQQKSGADIAVVTLESLQGRSVEDVAIDIGRSYKIGDKNKNNGVVFLTAINDRKMRIELGTGLESKISISTLNQIRDNDILPYYREENYKDGIARGTYILAQTVATAEGVEIKPQGTCPHQKNGNSNCNDRIPLWAWPFIILYGLFARKRRFDSGGFGGFGGGGGFGGHGCSGSW